MPKIVAMIPAHNEEAGITKTVRSILAQSVRPDRVIVMADNCTDLTIPRARAAGAEVIETVNNRAKKAGALNQGFDLIMPDLDDSDFFLLQDADGEISPQFVENALALYTRDPNIGGLSGAIAPRTQNNYLEIAQAIEYIRGTRNMSRNNGRVHVLSGAATVFPVRALRHVARSRGTQLPGVLGCVFMEDSLTEDYELTLAIKTLGYRCTSTKNCRVTTDLMPTYKMLFTQRLRWFRGSLESLWLYGWTPQTHRIWCGVFFTFFVSILSPLTIVMLGITALFWGVHFNPLYTAVLPIFMLEGVVAARRLKNWKASAVSVLFLPLWLYDNFMFVIYWRALLQAVHGRSRVWVT